MQLDIQDVLIIDDSTLQRQHGCEICQGLGAQQIRQAANGEEGLERMREHLPSLILLDLEMPKLDGVQVMQHMAREGLNAPLVVTSSKDYLLISTVELMGRELGLPVLGGLKKPLRQPELLDLLKRVWTPKGGDEHHAELFSEVEVREALDKGEIIPYYQPKVTLNGGLLKGAEMLARWQHPELGIVSPARFIPVVETSGWATELTLNMLDQGLKQWQEWARRGLRLPLSVNLSALSLKGDDLTQQIEQRLLSTHVPPRFIIFEVTETAIADNLAEAIGIAARLRLGGLGLSIDDFGTGFATLQQLTRFPFTELKIDQSLVTSVSTKPHLEAVLNSVIELAQRMQLTTVAEGIETTTDLDFMGNRGCLMGQGYFIAKPMDAPHFESWVKERMQQHKEASTG
ncbi:EAL domain-containing response regulator [Chromobacterium haemolyticum]|uniref:EAL domain-containing response regulator n=1 Tax=Chromobacterium haemolyticum TaxID=394935 RepID=UPI0009F0F0CE|nr:EAL domain-containing response regulator [Chromobacterium haemolyticum]OQS42639.1 two-component response regulator [Chromobacterium haemolyticum]